MTTTTPTTTYHHNNNNNNCWIEDENREMAQHEALWRMDFQAIKSAAARALDDEVRSGRWPGGTYSIAGPDVARVMPYTHLTARFRLATPEVNATAGGGGGGGGDKVAYMDIAQPCVGWKRAGAHNEAGSIRTPHGTAYYTHANMEEVFRRVVGEFVFKESPPQVEARARAAEAQALATEGCRRLQHMLLEDNDDGHHHHDQLLMLSLRDEVEGLVSRMRARGRVIAAQYGVSAAEATLLMQRALTQRVQQAAAWHV